MSGPNAELVAGDLHFPTSVTFDAAGNPYVAESGLPFAGAPPGGRVWRIAADGRRDLVAGGFSPPVNGVTHHAGSLFVSVGGHPSRIVRLDLDGHRAGGQSGGGDQHVVVAGLPGPGNYQTNMAIVGADDRLYFSQGAMTNSGIVGLDAYEIGWLGRLPHSHDVPGLDVVLTGVNVRTPDPLSGEVGAEVETGAFVPFGTPTAPHQRVPAGLPCTAAVMRCRLDGSELELVAWGLRNAYGLGFLPDGRLLAVDQGADDRGSRPIGNAPDLLVEVRGGAWYGWPDFIGDIPVTDPRFVPERGAPPTFLLANHDTLPAPEPPLAVFPPHAAATRFDVAPTGLGPWSGQLVVALFGDEAPMTAPSGPPVGRGLVRVDPTDWSLHQLESPPLSRPIDVRFWPGERALAVLDFGAFEMSDEGVVASAGTGALWKLTLEDEGNTT